MEDYSYKSCPGCGSLSNHQVPTAPQRLVKSRSQRQYLFHLSFFEIISVVIRPIKLILFYFFVYLMSCFPQIFHTTSECQFGDEFYVAARERQHISSKLAWWKVAGKHQAVLLDSPPSLWHQSEMMRTCFALRSPDSQADRWCFTSYQSATAALRTVILHCNFSGQGGLSPRPFHSPNRWSFPVLCSTWERITLMKSLDSVKPYSLWFPVP